MGIHAVHVRHVELLFRLRLGLDARIWRLVQQRGRMDGKCWTDRGNSLSATAHASRRTGQTARRDDIPGASDLPALSNSGREPDSELRTCGADSIAGSAPYNRGNKGSASSTHGSDATCDVFSIWRVQVFGSALPRHACRLTQQLCWQLEVRDDGAASFHRTRVDL